METIQIETNVVVVNNEPDFVADTHENVSANFVILCEDNMTSLPKNIYEYKSQCHQSPFEAPLADSNKLLPPSSKATHHVPYIHKCSLEDSSYYLHKE